MRLVTTARALMVAAILSAPVSTSAAQLLDAVVAKVNNQIITFYEVDKALKPYALGRGIDTKLLSDPSKLPELQRRVVESIIEDRLVAQETSRLRITVSQAAIDRALGIEAQQRGITMAQLQQGVERFGVSWEQYQDIQRRRLRKLELIRAKIGRKVAISDAEIDAAYNERFRTKGGEKLAIDVSHILMGTGSGSAQEVAAALERAKAAKARLEAGEPFGQVAREMSEGPSAEDDGRLGEHMRGGLAPEFEKYAFALEPGETSGIVRTQFGYHIIYLNDKKELPVPDEELAKRRRRVEGELRSVATERQYRSYLKGLRSRAFVEIKR